VWAAVMVQLHLFFVAQLHHHALRLLQQETHNTMRQARADLVPLPDPPRPCPACQIARQGSVTPASNIQAANPAYLEEQIQPLPSSFAFQVMLKLHPGRDPPSFS